MTRELVTYKVCDKCPGETEAVSTERFSLNGYKYEVDLCAKHAAELYALLMAWADLGVCKGEPSLFDRAAPARTTVVPVRRRTANPVTAEQRRLAAQQREPLPPTAERWLITDHARERMLERGVDTYEVLMAAERPDMVNPRTTVKPGQKRDDAEERYRGDVKLIVNPHTAEVLTVARQSTSNTAPTREKASA